MQGAGAVGVGGVPWPGLQQGRTHVAAQKQLDHLEGGVKSRGPKKRGGGPQEKKTEQMESHSAPRGDLPRRGQTRRPGPGASCPSCPPCRGWTGAAAAFRTAGATGTVRPGGSVRLLLPQAPCRPQGQSLPHHSDRAGPPSAGGCGPRRTGCSPLSPPSAPASWAPSGPARPRSAEAAGLGGVDGGSWELELDPDPDPNPDLQDADPTRSCLNPDQDPRLTSVEGPWRPPGSLQG